MADNASNTGEPEETGATAPGASGPAGSGSPDRSEDGDTANVDGVDDLIEAQDADVETSLSDTDEALLREAEKDLVADMRNDMLRAQAELVNFRNRVERDRTANREIVIAEVLRALLPAMDDLTRAESHGDLEGSPLAVVAQKIHGAFDRFGLTQIGVKGDAFDPNFHEAVVQIPSPEVTVLTVADVIEPGYALGDRVLRAAKVVVNSPAE